jgi:ABC-type bacteriocin/lantibiotic exporter with double-glycine peptidase domain
VDSREISHIYIYAFFTGFLSLVLPLGIQSIINFMQTGKTSTSWFMIIIFVVTSIALTGILQLLQLRITENLQQKIFTRSSFEFTFRFSKLDLNALGSQFPPELSNRFFDTMTVQKGIPKILIDVPTSVLQIVFGLILLSLYHPFFIAFSLILVILLVLSLRYTSIKGYDTSLEESKFKYKTAHWIQEIARCIPAFKMLGRNDYHLKVNDKYASNYINARERHFGVLRMQYIHLIGFKVLIALSLLLIGGILVISQQMNIGQFIASEIIILLVMNSVEKLMLSLSTVYDLLTGLEKIGEIADLPLDDSDEKGIVECWKEDMNVLGFRNVQFESPYEKKNLLSGLNFTITSGRHFAIAGGSELTRSTFLKLVQGIYAPSSGERSVNDVPFKNLTKDEYFHKIGTVQFDDSIFYGTMLDNIKMGRESVTMERVIAVCKELGLLNFINSLPDGFETYLLSDGKFISKMNKKRILLARAIVDKPLFLIIEDLLEFLMNNDHQELIEYLFRKDNGWTVVSTIKSQQLLPYFQDLIVVEDNTMKTFGPTENVLKEVSINKFCHA